MFEIIKKLNPINLIKKKGTGLSVKRNFVIKREDISLGHDLQGAVIFRSHEVVVIRPNVSYLLSTKGNDEKYFPIDNLKDHILVNLSQWNSISMKDVNGAVYEVNDTKFGFSVLKTLCKKQGNVDQIKFNVKVSNVE